MRSKKNQKNRVIIIAISLLAILSLSYLYQQLLTGFDDRAADYLREHRIPALSSFAHLTIRNSFWLPFYCSVILFTTAIYHKRIFSILIFLGLMMMVCDYLTIIIAHLFSISYAAETSINLNETLYYPVKGTLDFANMHAACAFAMVIFFMLLLNRHYFLLQAALLLWALLISYNWLFETQNHSIGILLEMAAGMVTGSQAYKLYREHFLVLKLQYEN